MEMLVEGNRKKLADQDEMCSYPLQKVENLQQGGYNTWPIEAKYGDRNVNVGRVKRFLQQLI